MQAFKKVGVIIALSALSLSSAWATDGFVAKATLDSFNVVPPVLTARANGTLTLPLDSQPPQNAAATGEAIAQIPPRRNFLAASMAPGVIQLAQSGRRRNVWRMTLTEPMNEVVGDGAGNIRLYLGQSFANGRPIATLCDNVGGTGRPLCFDGPAPNQPGDDGISVYKDEGESEDEDDNRLRLTDFLFEGQQINRGDVDTTTIAGIPLSAMDIVSLDHPPTKFRLQNTKNALKLIRTLIKRGLIYALVNSEFTALVEGGEITGYEPADRGLNGDGEVRGTLRLKQ